MQAAQDSLPCTLCRNAHYRFSPIWPFHALLGSPEIPKKRMATKRGRVAGQQQLAPCAGHADVHAADVGQEAELALGVAAFQGDRERG